MAIYMALLRGINVGGNNKIKMAELKTMFEGLGLDKVRTYIQSGNVLFVSDEESDPLRIRLENAIEKTFGFRIRVILRKQTDIDRIIARLPFSEDEIRAAAEASPGKEVLYVAMLEELPKPEAIARLGTYEKDKYHVEGLEIYQLFHQSILDSKLSVNLQKLGVAMTVRNWKTMNKLAELCKEIESEAP
ncbi:DUF1697 domain-containing protein [Cohnella endophytica]|uniref:DUF1697 domain-containing protein n=1 Tax=Cohnella endophytica TaxID=2419778 RepID=A0A494XPI7_9BACL|nr:DUF1697 domain-containing protein [Cohnella endophytica]RKP50049.1 DUF1697 domain-containing protein [Cohnella endophytica]